MGSRGFAESGFAKSGFAKWVRVSGRVGSRWVRAPWPSGNSLVRPQPGAEVKKAGRRGRRGCTRHPDRWHGEQVQRPHRPHCCRWDPTLASQVGSGSNPLSRTHFPSGFAWVRGSGFAKQVGSQWVRAKVGFWPCGFAVGSRQSGFAKVGSSGFANVGSRKVGSRGKHQSGFAVGSRKWVREWVREKGVSRENVSGETGFADSGFASGFAWNPLAFRSGFAPPSPKGKHKGNPDAHAGSLIAICEHEHVLT